MAEILFHPLSTYARRVHMALLEKGLASRFEMVVVDMPAREHRRAPFTDLNPYGRVPVLRVLDGGPALPPSCEGLAYFLFEGCGT